MRAKRRKKASSIGLNTLGIVAAFAFLIFAFSRNSPALLAQSADSSLAAASMTVSAGVAPNQYNTLAAQLQQKEAQLDQEQNSIQQQSASVDMLGVYSLLISLALFILVAFNFYFDWKRSRTPLGSSSPFSVDLSSRR